MTRRILVATDRSGTATRAVEWAAEMADRYAAELLVVQVVAPENLVGGDAATTDSGEAELAELATRLAGARGRSRMVYHSDPADAIVETAETEHADIIVVGNVTMSGRTQFLLGSVPNRVSHNARCTVVIVNTAGAVESATDGSDRRHRAHGDSPTGPAEGDMLRRVRHIGAVMAKHGLRNLFSRGGDRESGQRAEARRFRDALEELGPTFAKLGQILSTRPDLLPPAFIEELATLQDHVTPLTEAEVVAAMETELRVPWEDVFEEIEPDPMAAGTIAQVHRATLVGGERVVVKVQRPTAEAEILQDLGLLDMFGRKAADRPAFSQVIDLPAIIEHLSSSLRRELDFRQEAANIERMRGVLSSYSRLEVPRVFPELSTARLLVMEEVQGVPVREAPPGEARVEAARQFLDSYYRQVLTEGFFHADPHPGNLRWWKDRIYLLDFGMVGELDADVREYLLLMLLAFWQEDSEFLAEIMLMMAGTETASDFDSAGFRNDIAELVTRYRHLALSELRLGPLLQELTALSIRHDVRLPAALALTGKAFGQMQLAAAELDPSLDPLATAGRFFIRQVIDQARGTVNPQRMLYQATKLRLRLSRMLEAMEQVTGARPGAHMQIDFQGTERLEGVVRRAGWRVAIAFMAGMAWVATGISAGSGHVAGWFNVALGILGAVLTVVLLIDLAAGRR